MNRMYVSRHKKIGIMIAISLLFLMLFFLFVKHINAQQTESRLAEKIEAMGTEEFQMALWNSSVSAENGQEIEIDWWYNDENDTWYFFLPAEICDDLKYVFNVYESVWIDEEEVVPGEVFALETGGHLVQLETGEQIALEVMKSENLSAMFIETDLGDITQIQESKALFDTGSYILLDSRGEVNCKGILDSIKCRGNMTFDVPDKKSYNIRMQNKTAVLNLGIARGWSLLANAFDESLIRNQLVTEMGKAMDMAYVPDMDYVDLYINGEYQGNYQLAEKVEISKERLNIRNLQQEMELLNPDVEFDFLEPVEEPVGDFAAIKWVEGLKVPANTESGYLLELDMTYRYYEEQSGFITSRLQPVVIKSPQCVTYEQAFYVANLYQDMEDSLCAADGYNEGTGKYYYDYIDMDSFARKYLVDEISKNLDAALTSFYMYIPENDVRLYAGPIWDYDRTFGVDFERSGVDLKDPRTFYVSENIYFEESDVNIFHLLCQQEEFQKTYKELYFEEVRDVVVEIAEHVAQDTTQRIESSAMMDAIRCRSLSDPADVEANREEFREYGDSVRSFLEERILFLDEAWK